MVVGHAENCKHATVHQRRHSGKGDQKTDVEREMWIEGFK